MLQSEKTHALSIPVLALGFRLFFLLAGFAALGLMALWLIVLQAQVVLPARVPTLYWHGHEMLFGYVMAVIAGFLLTAVRNWTGQPTVTGAALGGLGVLWLLPRLLLPLDSIPLPLIAIVDLAFAGALLVAIYFPIRAAGQIRRQLEVLLAVTLLLLFNAAFYGEALGVLHWGFRISLYGGLYAALYLVLVVGRRIIPLFTERGVGYKVTLRNHDGLDRICTLTFLLFAAADVLQVAILSNLLALSAAVAHGIRWWGWQTPGSYKKPLLWSLHVGYGLVVIGFLLAALNLKQQVPASIIYHLFALGGVALVTMGMMARVALGHTGRDVHQPPAFVGWMQILLLVVIVFRVAMPLLMPGQYGLWIELGQIAWLLAALMFVAGYWKTLVSPRADGQPG